MKYSVLIVAAGKRAGEGRSYEKALASFNDTQSVVGQTLSIFLEDEKCSQIVIVTSPADMTKMVSAAGNGKVLFVKGGQTRQESVLIGLMAISEDVVLIHDGVRPWLRQELIDRLLERMTEEKACVLAIEPRTSIHRVENGYITETIEEGNLMMTQTPQAFHTSFMIQCIQKAIQQGLNFTDDAAMVAAVSDVKIAVEQGDIRNARYILKS